HDAMRCNDKITKYSKLQLAASAFCNEAQLQLVMRITQVPLALARRACHSALAQVPVTIRARNALIRQPDSQIITLASQPRSGAFRPRARSAHPSRHQPRPSLSRTLATTPTRSSPVPLLSPMMAPDPSSLSNFTEIRVTHSDFELDVNLDKKIIEGYVQIDAVAEVDSPSHLLLDTRDLTIHRVELHSPLQSPQGQGGPIPLKFQVDEPHKVLGSALRLELPADLVGPLTRGSRLSLGVRFTTSPSSSAVQFLDPAQTAGGRQPYLFTQCQAIHARSLVPCQDSPGAKMSYSAVVRVPQPLTALMSAVPDEPADGLPHLADVEPQYPTSLFSFHQKVPIAPYLLALAVGELSSATLGPRTRVWSEPSMVEAGAYEFADTNKFLEAGEAIAGEYVWGRYDLLLLPPSFPYGGMENPCLTFVTPTLLAGDRSLTNVVAHEIAHSWTGNLVTNANWEHFWLNEGFTVFLERKILGHLHGPATFQFHAAQGAAKLALEVERLGADNPYTRLVPDLSGGVDPDDVFSSIP
ncbi:hypothetical protein Vafri_17456, partial [Volvox africanus]